MLPLLSLPPPRTPELVTFNVVGAERASPGLVATFEKDPKLRRLALAALDRAFARYPAGAVKGFLDRVYVADDLRYEGTQMGGFSMPGVRAIWLAVGQAPDRDTARWFEDSFHHELAHVLLGQRRNVSPTRRGVPRTRRGSATGTRTTRAVSPPSPTTSARTNGSSPS